MRLVQRAGIIAAMMKDPDLSAGDAGVRAGYHSVGAGPMWVQRFSEAGLAGLEDEPRSGRRATHSREVRSALLSSAMQKPRSLGYPFELWALERLQKRRLQCWVCKERKVYQL